MLMGLEFSRKIFEKYSKNFMKIRPVGAQLFHANGQPDHNEADNRFSQYFERA